MFASKTTATLQHEYHTLTGEVLRLQDLVERLELTSYLGSVFHSTYWARLNELTTKRAELQPLAAELARREKAAMLKALAA